MGKIYLDNLTINVYNEHEALAYIYFGNSQSPLDHTGNSIKTFGNHIKRQAYEQHLRNALAPFFNKALHKIGFDTNEVSSMNQIPRPFLVIRKSNHTAVSDEDVRLLHQCLEKCIEKYNKQNYDFSIRKHNTNSVSFFDANKTTRQATRAKHTYYLRSIRP